jgi:hypothetical protein
MPSRAGRVGGTGTSTDRVLWLFHQSDENWATGQLSSITKLAEFGEAAFEWLAVGQAVVLLVLVPATVGGAVAEARSRQTLPRLLAAPVSSAAIIVDLLAAKMVRFGVVLAVGLPLAALLSLLGGVDPRSVVYAYAGTLSTSFFVAALSLLVWVYSRQPRTAVLRAYGIEFLWLVGPVIGTFVLASGSWLRPLARLNVWIAPTTPLSLVSFATLSAWPRSGPIRVLFRPPVLVAFLWFAAAVGVLCSLRSKTSVQALVKTLAVLLVLNLGTLFAGRILTTTNETAALFGNTLVLLSILAVPTHELSGNFVHPIHLWRVALYLGALLFYVAAYAALAWSRTWLAIREFDAAADRPRLPRSTHRWNPALRVPSLRGGSITRGAAARR